MQSLPSFLDDTPDESFEALLYDMGENRFSIDLNRRLKKSWNVKKQGNFYRVAIPAVLRNCSVDVKRAIIQWAQIMISVNLSRKKLTADQRSTVSGLEAIVWEAVHGDIESARKLIFENPEERFRHSFGIKFDLRERFDSINAKYFESELVSFLRWGQHGSKTSYHTVIADEQGSHHHLITIAGLYNHPSVPTYALDGVLYHEMCHIACPPIEGAQRRNVHHRAFREREQQYVHFEKWQKWMHRDASKILRRVRRATR